MNLRAITIAACMLWVGAAAHAAEGNPAAVGAGSACCEPERFVYAEFWYGARKVVAPVRRGPLGDEVELPGGIWVSCELSCEYTLRKQTLRYLESLGVGSGSAFGPAYPRADSYVDSWGYRQGYLF